MKIADTFKQAYVSPCGLYRPWLSRQTTEEGVRRKVLFILNNPSTADDLIDDPTVKRGWGFTEAWGCNMMVFANTNSYRSTDPRKRQPMPRPWAEYNDQILQHFATTAAIVVCAWGDKADPGDARRAQLVLTATGMPLHYLGSLTKHKNPRHILYLKGDLCPTVWQ